MEWTLKQRYRTYDSMTQKEQKKLEALVSDSIWRQKYHIQPQYGLLNDPNGFVWYNGRYYLFYQWFPFGAVHGMKHWFQTESFDLVNWENKGVALKPEYGYESHGIYSGSGFVHDQNLYLFYTANKRDDKWNRHAAQCLAIMDIKGEIVKLPEPIIKSQPQGYTEHFRDPKVWKADNKFYMIVGAQRQNSTGCALLYQSSDLKQWTWIGEVKTKERDFGFMWECPDYFELQNHGVLLFSPQGLQPKGDVYQNIYQSGYFIGNPLDTEKGSFEHGDFQELDAGFDFYAPQTTLSPDGRRILVGWMGLPEIEYPTDSEGWAHCLTLPRELSIHEEKVIQKPVVELELLRGEKVEATKILNNESTSFKGIAGDIYELLAEFSASTAKEFGIELRVGANEKTVIKYNSFEKKISFDRTHSGQSFAEEFGSIRKCSFESKTISIRVFVDVSSVEIFVNNGEKVFTGRIFPSKESRGIRFFSHGGRTNVKVVKWVIDEK
ncbi:sucrose-6-phosphate hydrolase [Neobacillus niacini]|uniref:glycoside hydrolase family 32 protein n=1 Tax=Neobacillus niacini TaxID=86668 RepID=UPI001C8DC793|nr:sucrose-6-phosphate hydrolase [Neobacillus niacini]MBY0146848.1 sucrose-6-phosphate hydrolase [Neobacillus niacini]